MRLCPRERARGEGSSEREAMGVHCYLAIEAKGGGGWGAH